MSFYTTVVMAAPAYQPDEAVLRRVVAFLESRGIVGERAEEGAPRFGAWFRWKPGPRATVTQD